MRINRDIVCDSDLSSINIIYEVRHRGRGGGGGGVHDELSAMSSMKGDSNLYAVEISCIF